MGKESFPCRDHTGLGAKTTAKTHQRTRMAQGWTWIAKERDGEDRRAICRHQQPGRTEAGVERWQHCQAACSAPRWNAGRNRDIAVWTPKRKERNGTRSKEKRCAALNALCFFSGGLSNGLQVLCHRENGHQGEPHTRWNTSTASPCQPDHRDQKRGVHGNGGAIEQLPQCCERFQADDEQKSIQYSKIDDFHRWHTIEDQNPPAWPARMSSSTFTACAFAREEARNCS